MIKVYHNAREMAEAITRGELPAQYIGTPTYESLKQELISLKQNYKPEVWISHNGKYIDSALGKWQEDMARVTAGIKTLPEEQQTQMKNEIDALFAEYKVALDRVKND